MSKHEKSTERLCGWLSSFVESYAKKNNITDVKVEEPKTAYHLENILDIVSRNKKVSVESKVEEYRKSVGLDMIDSIEKSSTKEASKIASRIPLSRRDKTAQSLNKDDIFDKIKQYVNEVIRNRNGAIATPAIFDQLEHYLKLDKEWIRDNFEDINHIVEEAHRQFSPQTYNNIPIKDLVRTDEPTNEKEKPLFSPPAPTT